jgi:hypothetical protein
MMRRILRLILTRSQILAPVRDDRAAGWRTASRSKAGLRSWLFAVALLLAASLFIFGGLCEIGWLYERHCGAAFGYYGCDTQHF